jgi:hypothetical protein
MILRTILFISVFLFAGFLQAAENVDASNPSDPLGAGKVVLKTLPVPIQSLLQYALSYEGVIYRRGGTNPEVGFDCSGFVRHVFDRVEGITLPHSAKAISQIGDGIKVTELIPGDLVFFRVVRNTISHVGIYLGNNQFIHASSTNTGSVMISNLKDNYWAKHFSLGRRLEVPAEQLPVNPETLPALPPVH